MSVHKRTYRPFTGTPTSRAARFGVLVRYSLSDVWSSRITNVLFLICMVPTVISMATIYIMNNNTVRMLIASGAGPAPTIAMGERYFYIVFQIQCWISLALTAWVAPRLISLDLSNNALATILSRPISRLEYILAKLSVIAGFISAVTWAPLLFLFGFQSFLSAQPWAWSHLHIATGILAGSAIWITLLSLLALAVSSWVRWRIVATGMLFAVIFIPAGMGGVYNAVMRTDSGNLVNIPFMMYTLWRRLFHVELPQFMTQSELPTAAMLLSIAVICTLCAMALNSRIRGREVVRG